MIAKIKRKMRLSHPPSLSAYGIERIPIPHKTFMAAIECSKIYQHRWEGKTKISK